MKTPEERIKLADKAVNEILEKYNVEWAAETDCGCDAMVDLWLQHRTPMLKVIN
jgi:hypothetical protein